MKLRLLFLIPVSILILTSCTSRDSEIESQHSAELVDLSTLPDVIDVQTAATLMNNDDVLLIDVREQWEYDEKHIPGITLIPMSELESRISEIPTDKTVVLTCRSGNRSGQVHAFLAENGYDNTHNMEGGILAWEAAGFEVE